MNIKNKKIVLAQSTLEYAILIAVVASAFMAMSVYFQRAVKANFKVIEEEINR